MRQHLRRFGKFASLVEAVINRMKLQEEWIKNEGVVTLDGVTYDSADPSMKIPVRRDLGRPTKSNAIPNAESAPKLICQSGRFGLT